VPDVARGQREPSASSVRRDLVECAAQGVRPYRVTVDQRRESRAHCDGTALGVVEGDADDTQRAQEGPSPVALAEALLGPAEARGRGDDQRVDVLELPAVAAGAAFHGLAEGRGARLREGRQGQQGDGGPVPVDRHQP